MSRNDLPSENSTNFNARLRETLMTYLGKVGDPLDRGITLRDLVDSGIVTIANLSLAKKSGSLPLDAGEKTRAGDSPDLTPPPTPTGFAVAAAITSVFIEHDIPLYTQGHGHLRTRVYGVVRSPGDPAPVFADAAEITQFSGAVSSYATNPSTVWHLWIKWESVDGVLSASPAGGTNGLVATTGQDVSLLLQALTGQITESQLFTSLGERIDLIDGPVTLANSVAYLLAEEAALRADAIAAEALARTNAISTSADNLQDQIDLLSAASAGDVGALIASVKAEQDARAAADLNFSTQVNTLSVSNSGVQAAVKTEENTRITADLKEATRSTTLIARTGELTAGVFNEAVTRTTADSSQAAQTQVLFASSGQNTAGLLEEVKARASDSASQVAQTSYLVARTAETTSGLLVETAARSTSDSAQSSQVTSLFSAVGTTSAGLTTETTVRSGADSAQALQTSALTASFGQNVAGLLTETTIRATDATSQAAQTSALTSAVGANVAGLHTEVTTRSTNDSAQAAQTSLLLAKTGDLTAGLLNESSVRSDSDSAQAAQISTAIVSTGNSKAAVNAETTARATADSANASQVNQLQSTVGTAVAGLAEERIVSAAANQAAATQATALTAVTRANTSALLLEQTTRTNADSAFSGQVTSVAATTANTSASITSEINARASADSSQASVVNLLAVSTGANSAAVASEVVARTNATGSIVSTVYGLAAVTGNTNAGLQVEQNVRATQDSAVSSQVTTVAAGFANSLASVQNTQNVLVAQDSATAGQLQAVAASTGQSTAAVQLEQTTRTTADSAVSSAVNTVQSQWGTNTAALQVEASTRATQTGELYAQYTVKIDTNGYVSGYGLATTAGTSLPSSSFAVRADTFYIANPTGPSVAPAMPFIVRTTPTTIGGVAVPVGVYMTDAFIQNGTITNAKIANLAVDVAKIADLTVTAAKIADATITAAKITDATITSAKIANATITAANIADATITAAKIVTLDATTITAGTLDAARIGANSITAAKIDSRGLTIKDSAGNVIFSSGSPLASNNTVPNSSMLYGIAPITAYINPTYDSAIAVGTPILSWTYNAGGAPLGYGAATIRSVGSVHSDFSSSIRYDTARTPCSPGQRIEASAYVAVYRGEARLEVSFMDASGAGIASTVVADGVSTATEPVSGNTITNSSMLYGIAPITAYINPAYDSAVAVGTPILSWTYNANGAPVGYGAATISAVGPIHSNFSSSIHYGDASTSCLPGQRIEASAYVAVYRGQARLEVTFKNSSGTVIASTVVADGVSVASEPATFDQNLSTFTRLWGFVTAPANAATCYIEVRFNRTSTAQALNLYMALPYLGFASATQTTTFDQDLSTFTRLYGFVTAPANAATCYIEVRFNRTNAVLALNLYMALPYLGYASATQTAPSYWVDGPTRISDENASTYIADAAVDTLQIAGQAVTIPTSSLSVAGLSIPIDSNWYDVQTVTYTSTGAPVLLAYSFDFQGTGTGGNDSMSLRMVYNSAEIYITQCSLGSNIPLSATTLHSVATTGSRTYKIQARVNTGISAMVISNRVLTALETKR